MIAVAEDQRTAYIGLVGGVLSVVVLLLGTGLVVYIRRRKGRHVKQVAAMMPGSGSNSGAAAGLILNTMHPSSHQSSSTTLDSSGAGGHHLSGYPGAGSKRTTLLSLKQLSGKSNSLLLAPSARDGFYGPVSGGGGSGSGMTAAESDSDTSSFYHEPYQQRPVISNGTFQQQQRMLHQQRGYPASSPADPEYGCLIQKEPLVLTPKGLHSNGLYHKQQSKSASNTLASGYANPQPYSSIKSFFKSSGSVVPAPSNSAATSFVNNSQPENYYATTDIIHVREGERSAGNAMGLKPLFEETNIHSPSVLNPFDVSVPSESSSTNEQISGGQLNNYKLACFLAGQPPPPPPPPRNLLHSSPQQQSPTAQPFPSSLSPYVVPVSSPVDSDICPPDVGRSHIRLVEKLGEGTFGALHLAELDTGDFGSQQRKLVVLRLIRTHRNGNKTTENNHQEMIREVRRLSVLRDPSIAKVVAVATTLGGPTADGDASTLGVMTEYLEGGPLPVYLRQYRLGATDNFEPGVKTIR